ncbi:MAG: molecular chaperone TorD family protein [Epsilonproteobacteria bacterium]|nr:molecular chaperone TorD family protein [Campylobacterota bacterium]OIO17056.1 MAG: dehydrogenase [Helicobacteraceae bacterium CG1_02_36_14]PIP09232.1 MAG: dehydrogenase [Sulfurimonas sp. CG23_combo_of_CG06-09_8_20_14_all_36_33]PIS24645.1 MAG: dehydrogenase [Sulfurimonas sp. CG08_land_8_20_14_0_20_36_33]PIU34994.1 MAG: dehydrogenase [Sulfurimonas sp. CG07_land_8_20_14_0_80_36_56]PIV02974.1 MAG: dehydrogenase [Sulfurimonas sp. CG03_land_8_20_14_0_80_36_25]PIV36738.1 MAG: dehydrogenase [Sulf
MDKEYRLYIYAFLSRTMADSADKRYVSDLRNNRDFLELLGESTVAYFDEKSDEVILDELNEDFSSMFVINTQAVESFVLDAKNETLVGLQNPVMNFYYKHGFELNMDQTELMAPDHLSIEFAFMQTLIFRNEPQAQADFLKEHLFNWVVPYMMGMKSMALTPFYSDICDFIVEFLVADYEYCTTLEKSRDE